MDQSEPSPESVVIEKERKDEDYFEVKKDCLFKPLLRGFRNHIRSKMGKYDRVDPKKTAPYDLL